MKSGFVYIWRCSRRKMYYIGSHQGTLDDDYITSSAWMLRAYLVRPKAFKRRILFFSERISRKDLLIQEQKWLDLIKPEEVGNRYFNLKLKAAGGNGGANKGQTRTAEMKEKIRQANIGKKQSPELIARRIAPLIGRKKPASSKATCEKIRIANTGKKQPAEVIAKRIISLKKAWQEGAYKNRPRPPGIKLSSGQNQQ